MPAETPIFRFAPSPNGRLHLGHARSALLNAGMARAVDGVLLIRVEDIDKARCTPTLETAMLRDLDRLGVASDRPIRRQSEHFDEYAQAFDQLRRMGLVYPTFLSRAEIKRAIARLETAGGAWPRDPDGTPHYPGGERDLPPAGVATRAASGEQVTWRLDMARAVDRVGTLFWDESGTEAGDATLDRAALAGRRGFRRICAEPQRWGDVIIARADVATSYHLSVVVDDALQRVTDVVRGADLYHATSVHRLLQELLDLPAPRYHHHALVRDSAGRKLAKSDGDEGLGALLDQGIAPADIIGRVGLR